MRKRSSFLYKLVLLCVGSALGFLAVEAGLRLAGYQVPHRPPGFRGSFVFGEDPDEEYRVAINTEGFRGREIADGEGPIVFVIGDSHMYGPGVDQEDLLAYRLEHHLSKHLPAVRVYNFSDNGASLIHYARTLERYKRLRPDLVVMVIYAGNDLAAHANFVAGGGSIQQFVASEEAAISSVESVKVLARHLRTYHLVATGLKLVRLKNESALATEGSGAYLQMMGQADYFLAPSHNLTDSAREFESAIRFVRDELAEDTELLGVLLPTKSGISGSLDRVDKSIAVRLGADPEALMHVDRSIHQQLGEVMARAVTHSIDLSDGFRTARTDELYWARDWHLRASGHEIAAKAVAELIHRRGLVDHDKIHRARALGPKDASRGLATPGVDRPELAPRHCESSVVGPGAPRAR